jgi:exonuclease VII large subunit
MNRGVLSAMVVGALALMVIGCGNRQPAQGPQTKQGGGATAPASQRLAEQKDRLITAASDALDSLQQNVQKLQAEAEVKGQQAKADYEQKIKPELEKRIADARTSLENARQAGASAWTVAKDKVDKAMDELQSAYNAAKAQLTSAPQPAPAPAESPSK